MKLTPWILGLAAFAAPAWGGEQDFIDRLGSPQSVLSNLGWKGLPAESRRGAAAPSGRPSLRFGRCALGGPQACLAVLRCGLRPEDRAAVSLGEDGGVAVDPTHPSGSGNFAALRTLAAGAARTVVDVLSPKDRYELRTIDRWPAGELVVRSSPMGHPDTRDGFLGYTFFEHLGRLEAGILYAPGPYTSVVVNSGQEPAAIAVTMHHEFRHVVLGAFGRKASRSKHGLSDVESAISEAERETAANAADCAGAQGR